MDWICPNLFVIDAQRKPQTPQQAADGLGRHCDVGVAQLPGTDALDGDLRPEVQRQEQEQGQDDQDQQDADGAAHPLAPSDGSGAFGASPDGTRPGGNPS